MKDIRAIKSVKTYPVYTAGLLHSGIDIFLRMGSQADCLKLTELITAHIVIKKFIRNL